jgi:hypothetical protein
MSDEPKPAKPAAKTPGAFSVKMTDESLQGWLGVLSSVIVALGPHKTDESDSWRGEEELKEARDELMIAACRLGVRLIGQCPHR